MNKSKKGFTLVEIMIVVVIIGLLAAIAIPAFSLVRQNSENTRFMSDLRTFKDALVMCVLETGDMDQGSSSGTLSPDLSDYVSESQWLEAPSIGGKWDVEYDKSGVTLGIGVHNPSVSPDQIAKIDERFDDGDVNTGKLRFIAGGRYYWVVEE